MTAATDQTAERRDDLAVLAVVVGAIAMGASPIFVRLADVGPFASAFWRAALALPFLWAWMRWERSSPLVGDTNDRLPWRGILLMGFFFAGDLFFWHLSIVNTTVANATFFATLSPVFVLLAGWLIFKEKISRNQTLGLVICLSGGTLLLGTSIAFAPERISGDAYGMLTGMFFAAYIITMGKTRLRGIPAGTVMFWSTAVTAAFLLPPALLFEAHLFPQSWAGFWWLLILAVIAQVGGQGLLSVALGKLAASFSSLVIFLEGVAAAFLGWVVLAEALTPLQVAGAMLIIFGVVVARGRPSKSIDG
ncbi:MAG: DMT family transporter [Pseudomonadota bacterium]